MKTSEKRVKKERVKNPLMSFLQNWKRKSFKDMVAMQKFKNDPLIDIVDMKAVVEGLYP